MHQKMGTVMFTHSSFPSLTKKKGAREEDVVVIIISSLLLLPSIQQSLEGRKEMTAKIGK